VARCNFANAVLRVDQDHCLGRQCLSRASPLACKVTPKDDGRGDARPDWKRAPEKIYASVTAKSSSCHAPGSRREAGGDVTLTTRERGQRGDDSADDGEHHLGHREKPGLAGFVINHLIEHVVALCQSKRYSPCNTAKAGNGGVSGGSAVEGVLIVGILFSIPIYIRASIALLRPLAVDPSGTRLAGHYRRWELRSVTGRILDTNAHSTTVVSSNYQASQFNVSSKSYLHQMLLLEDAAGQQHSFAMTNFYLQVFNGQVVSIGVAIRGKKQFPIAVLNHSTRLQFVAGRSVLDKIVVPRAPLLTLWVIASIIFLVIGNLLIGPVIAFFSLFFFALTNRRQRRRFGRSGLGALWTSTAATAAAL
jgi:hypothetical protein